MQKASIRQSHVYRWIKILRPIFEKVHKRNIPVKLFHNLTSGLREEDFLKIASCPYSPRSPHSPEPCLRMDQNFANNFWKRSPKEHSSEIISKSDQRFNPLPDNKILDRSKLKQSADDNFESDENSIKFSKRVEDTVGKGEIARYEQFPLFPQCFQKACFTGASKGVIVWECSKRRRFF